MKMIFSQDWRILEVVIDGPMTSGVWFEHGYHPSEKWFIKTHPLNVKEFLGNEGKVIEVNFEGYDDFLHSHEFRETAQKAKQEKLGGCRMNTETPYAPKPINLSGVTIIANLRFPEKLRTFEEFWFFPKDNGLPFATFKAPKEDIELINFFRDNLHKNFAIDFSISDEPIGILKRATLSSIKSSLCVEANGGGGVPPTPANARAKLPKFYSQYETVFERDDEGYAFVIADARSNDLAEQVAAAMNFTYESTKNQEGGKPAFRGITPNPSNNQTFGG